eukprot:CAMPEP_0205945606 /NCGR_PEP_ID=MMETSP1325-20131115/66600_1 /ASSEMBLY_ACC=CAM_ASM_000708 /TAXON_ID=236786 /ORGANISM="Florenciella sp., Strain RCC1007" /LENGTH=42 /DNA_ID= /DNA_START= /DNA_END= /DNA_ORIENTATION=
MTKPPFVPGASTHLVQGARAFMIALPFLPQVNVFSIMLTSRS